MARPLLLSAGSRGDLEPVTALACALAASPGAECVTYCAQKGYISCIPALPGLRAVEAPVEMSDFFQHYALAQESAAPDATPLEVSWTALGLTMGSLIDKCADLVLAAAREARCDVVVTTMCTWPLAHIVSAALQVPFVMLSFQPDLPSAYFPYIYLDPVDSARATVAARAGPAPPANPEYLTRARRLHRAPYASYSARLDAACARHGLPPVSFEYVMQIMMSTAPRVTTLFALQNVLALPPPDMPATAHYIGSLAVDYLPTGYSPAHTLPALSQFLTAGPPPIVVSYGSHGAGVDRGPVLRALLTGFRAAGVQRVVVLPGKAQLSLDMLTREDPADAQLLQWASEHVLVETGNVQYAWLLPQAEMLFCHGGAGCTAAAIHAGIPVNITPMMFDQFFHAEVVRLQRFGVVLGDSGLQSITADQVSEAVLEARKHHVMKKVKVIGEKEREGERAVDKAVRIICDLVQRK